MATLKTLQVLGRAYGNQPASQPFDFVRYQEFSGSLAGKANVSHRHNASDIDGLIPFLLEVAGENLVDSQSIIWIISGSELSSAQVRLKLNGGLLMDAGGLYVDSGTVSVPGHKHVASDITDFAAALFQQLELMFAVSNTISWSFVGNEISGTVVIAPASGLLETPDGLACDFGSGTNQVARGNHTHSQLHNPVTIVEGDSIDLELVGQQLTAEVRLAPLSGLFISGTGLACDFGSGTNQVARGNHSHALLHQPVTVQSDPSLSLAISPTQLLSGTVVCDPSPPGGFGKLVKGAGGISVELGPDSDEAAPGNHGHSVATEAEAGFLSAMDKTRLDTLWGEGSSGTLPQSGTMDSMSVRVLYLHNVNTGHYKAIYLDDLDRVHIGSGIFIKG